jgi:RimJ/RimL family protein N-acetyltransferase
MDGALARIDFPEVRLWVAADNHRSRRFYEAYGFADDDAADTYSVGGVELAVVRYSLIRS